MCGPNAQLNQAAATGAVELLDSLNSREFRLLVVQGHRQHALDSEFDVKLYAVIEPTRVGCITFDGGRRERAATKAALLRAPSAGRGCEVHCFVNLDLHETLGATPWNLARLCYWAVRIDRDEEGEPGEAAAAGGGPPPPVAVAVIFPADPPPPPACEGEEGRCGGGKRALTWRSWPSVSTSAHAHESAVS